MAQREQIPYLRSHSLFQVVQDWDSSHLSRVCMGQNSAGLIPQWGRRGLEDVCMHCPVLLDGVLEEVESESERRLVMSDSLPPRGLYSPWNSLGQNTGVGSLSLLQVMFPTQGLNPGLPHCRRIVYRLSHQWSPRILEGVAYPFSSRSSSPRNWTWVSCIAGGFFTSWATREALGWSCVLPKIHILKSQYPQYLRIWFGLVDSL